MYFIDDLHFVNYPLQYTCLLMWNTGKNDLEMVPGFYVNSMCDFEMSVYLWKQFKHATDPYDTNMYFFDEFHF